MFLLSFEGRNIVPTNSKIVLLPKKMESEAVSNLYKWSFANCGICYIPFIGDGYSSSYSAMNKGQLYGASVFVKR